MQPFIPPDDIRREHELMVRRELQRNYPEHHLYFRESEPVIGALEAIRMYLGRWLINAGMRIEPGARRSHDRSSETAAPMVGRMSRT